MHEEDTPREFPDEDEENPAPQRPFLTLPDLSRPLRKKIVYLAQRPGVTRYGEASMSERDCGPSRNPSHSRIL